MRHGIFLAPFDELADPRLLADLAARAEDRGWDGVFLWDHTIYRDPVVAVLDPWIAMAAMATRTSRIRLGPLVTPLARRRPWKVARETAALDLLSDGRLTLGVGLGGDTSGELSGFGEETDDRARAALLDEALAVLEVCWSGEPTGHEGEHFRVPPRAFLPRPVQRPRIPIWLAARYPNRRPVRRAARFDGLFPIDLPGPEGLEELLDVVREERGSLDGFDVVAEREPGADPEPWVQAGATWVLVDFGRTPSLAHVEATIDAGPWKVPGTFHP
ncbi:LLM class flavin-dependent oxidoreductase [Conexibacter sp. SYSU D00693]|uniref:LLM class flavin-dependent oxidoreductase n=1 Tax=Conexibacter sp. SYSU D00693 TaxID=2812560 RepID=UPI001F11D571|nr:LLM class flavin-dependent oxidoreductase [Conexibacter sp. SYSU D00693]